MTDLEITRLCAEAMEPPATLLGSSDVWGVSIIYIPEKKVRSWVKPTFRPLHDDAQAMVLVKKFNLGLAWSGFWSVYEQGNGANGSSADLNRAICECVAKMQAAK